MAAFAPELAPELKNPGAQHRVRASTQVLNRPGRQAASGALRSSTQALVHLGLDTVRLRGEGFTLHAAEQDQVTAGQPVVAWDTAPAIAAGYSTMVPVVLMDSPAGTVKPALQKAEAGDVLFTV